MVRHNFHTSWLENQNPSFLEEAKVRWTRSSQLKPWHHSLERQEQVEEDQTPIELSAPDAALLGIILSLTILGEVDDVIKYLSNPPSLNRLLTFMSLGIVGPLLRPKLGPGSSGFTNLDVQTQTKRVGIHLIRASFLKKTGLTSITCNFEVACENGDTGNLCMSSLPSSGTNDFSLPAQCTIESDLLKDPTGELYKTCRQVGFLYLLREGLLVQKVPKCRHCLNGGGLTHAWIFVMDLSTCTEGPQR